MLIFVFIVFVFFYLFILFCSVFMCLFFCSYLLYLDLKEFLLTTIPYCFAKALSVSPRPECRDNARKAIALSKVAVSDLFLKGSLQRADSWSLSSREVLKRNKSISKYNFTNLKVLRLLLTLYIISTFMTIFSVLSNFFNFKRAIWQLFKLLFEVSFAC